MSNSNTVTVEEAFKHVYCACVFAMRKELGTVLIKQEEWLLQIRRAMEHLNLLTPQK